MKKFRGIFTVIVALLALVVIVLYVCLNTPVVSRRLIPQLIQKNFKDYRIQSFSLASQQFSFPNKIVLQQLKLALVPLKSPDAKPYEINSGRLTAVIEPVPYFKARFKGTVDDLLVKAYEVELKGDVVWQREPSSDTEIKVDLQGTHFVYDEKYTIDRPYIKAALSLEKNKMRDLQGYLKIAGVEASAAKVSNIVSDLKGDDTQIVFSNFNAEAYEGKLSGEITVEHRPPFVYTVSLNIHKMNFGALEQTSAALFSQFEGALDGTILVKGDRNNIRTIQSGFSVPGGGKAKASLVAYLLQYIPQGTQQREVMDFLLSTDGKIAAEEITLDLKNVKPDQISGMYRITSKELNVDIHQSFDLNLDGDITSLFEMGNRIMDGLMAVVSPSHAIKEGS